MITSKAELTKRLLANFTKPGIKQIYLEENNDFYQIVIVLTDHNPHIIDNLLELEEVITDHHEKVKFLYKTEWSGEELIWEE